MGEILLFRASDSLTEAEMSLVKLWAERHKPGGVGRCERIVDGRGNVSISILDWDGFEIFYLGRQKGTYFADCTITFATIAEGQSIRSVVAALERRFTPLQRLDELEPQAIAHF